MVVIRKTENPKLVEHLAQIRHEQLRSWSKHLFMQLNQVKAANGTLDDFGALLNSLCKDSWHEYKDAPHHVKLASVNWAENVLKVIRSYET